MARGRGSEQQSRTEQARQTAQQYAGARARRATGQAAKTAGKAAAQGAKAATKLAAAGLRALVASGPVGWVVIGIIVLSLVVPLAFIALGASGKLGNSPFQASAAEDQQSIQEVLALSGDTAAQRQLILGRLGELKSTLQAQKTVLEKRPDDKSKQALGHLNTLLAKVDELGAKSDDPAAFKTVLGQIRAELDALGKLGFGVAGKEACRPLKTDGNVQFLQSNDQIGVPEGAVRRLDGKVVPIAPQVCGVLSALSSPEQGKFDLKIAQVVGNHSKDVKDSKPPRQSKHWTGRGIDITYVNGARIKDNQAPAGAAMCWIKSREAELKAQGLWPQQVIGPSQFKDCMVKDGKVNPSGYQDDTLKAHENHIHIGY